MVGGASGEAGLELGLLGEIGVIRARRAPGLATGWLLVQRSLETAPAPPGTQSSACFHLSLGKWPPLPGLCRKAAKEGAELVAGDRFNEEIE